MRGGIAGVRGNVSGAGAMSTAVPTTYQASSASAAGEIVSATVPAEDGEMFKYSKVQNE